MTKRKIDDLDAIVQTPEHEFNAVPAELDDRMAGFFAELRESEEHERALKRRRRVIHLRTAAAAGFAVILLLSFVGPKKVWTASQDAMAVVIRTVNSYTTLDWMNKGSENEDQLIPYELTYLPEGMKVVSEIHEETMSVLMIENGEGNNISYAQNVISKSNFLIDTEQTSIRMKKEENRLYYYYLNKNLYNIIWEENGQEFRLISDLEFETLFEVARGLVPAK